MSALPAEQLLQSKRSQFGMQRSKILDMLHIKLKRGPGTTGSGAVERKARRASSPFRSTAEKPVSPGSPFRRDSAGSITGGEVSSGIYTASPLFPSPPPRSSRSPRSPPRPPPGRFLRCCAASSRVGVRAHIV